MLTIQVVCGRELKTILNPTTSVHVAVSHGSQLKRTVESREVCNPIWDHMVELWDGELSETIEFMVRSLMRRRHNPAHPPAYNQTNWQIIARCCEGSVDMVVKHSMATVNMETYRTQPEKRFTQTLPLASLNRSYSDLSATAAQSTSSGFGELSLVLSYTEDIFDIEVAEERQAPAVGQGVIAETACPV